MRLTRGHLLKQDDWLDWQQSKFFQLNQYADQNCFGDPTLVEKDDAVFHLVWTYNIKALDGRKKARCVCDGSSRSGSVKILDKVYANCVDYSTPSRPPKICSFLDPMSAMPLPRHPPPKQGFFICPDQAFNEWWEQHLKKPPILLGHVIPVLSAMQGHPESPPLWEKHANAILCKLGLTPTTHEPCFYSGLIEGKQIVFMRQVDNFAIAAPDERTVNTLLDMLNKKLTMPIKRQGLLDMFNGTYVVQR